MEGGRGEYQRFLNRNTIFNIRRGEGQYGGSANTFIGAILLGVITLPGGKPWILAWGEQLKLMEK